ncbi:hypothetical protein A8E41_07685, partial [Burkholderia cenocepacia]
MPHARRRDACRARRACAVGTRGRRTASGFTLRPTFTDRSQTTMPALCDICHARPAVARATVMQDGE